MTQFIFPSESSQWPQVVSISGQTPDWQLQLLVSGEVTWFDGHFPGNPILPGVVQVFWAQYFSQQLLLVETFSAVKKLKFNQMILPESTVTLTLNAEQAKQRIHFQYHMNGETCSSGNFEAKFS